MGPVRAHSAGEHFEATFARCVRRDACPAQFALYGTDVDDLPAATADHRTGELASYVESADEVGVENAAKLLVSEVQQRTAVLNSGVVDHDVDGADLALDVDGGRHLLR